jgi:ketosteroid isomerase-like protein
MDEKDGLEFAGGEPKRGAAAIYDAHGGDKAETAVLTWKPAEVFVAASGDLGVTWGRWTEKPNDPERKLETGRYVTVWRKDAAGGWKGIIDIGQSN